MKYDFTKFKHAIAAIEEWLMREYSTIRTGQATPLILDGVHVEAYGNSMRIKDVASVSIEETRTLRVSPWDTSLIKAVEKGIVSANLGLSVRTDETGIRVVFPELTTERRKEYVKLAGQKLEEARISIRKEREKVLKDVERLEGDGEINEDEKMRIRGEVQKLVDAAGERLGSHREKKEREIGS